MITLSGFVPKRFRRSCLVPAAVTASYDINRHFRLVGIAGEALKSGIWDRGQKVQFLVRDNVLRTHVPVRWDARSGYAEFLFFLHGNGPGAAWAAGLKRGDLCWLSALRRCLDFADIKGRTIFFGDETSIGSALALSASAYAEYEHRYFLEASSPACCEQVLKYGRLTNIAIIQKTARHSHTAEIASVLVEAAREVEFLNWVFTGCAQTIQRVRNRLTACGMPLPAMIVKPYWAEGKVGLE